MRPSKKGSQLSTKNSRPQLRYYAERLRLRLHNKTDHITSLELFLKKLPCPGPVLPNGQWDSRFQPPYDGYGCVLGVVKFDEPNAAGDYERVTCPRCGGEGHALAAWEIENPGR